jgi:hypothetical protein
VSSSQVAVCTADFVLSAIVLHVGPPIWLGSATFKLHCRLGPIGMACIDEPTRLFLVFSPVRCEMARRGPGLETSKERRQGWARLGRHSIRSRGLGARFKRRLQLRIASLHEAHMKYSMAGVVSEASSCKLVRVIVIYGSLLCVVRLMWVW